MSEANPPVSFRVPPEERLRLTKVASYQGQSLSAFVRSCTLAVAQGIVDRVGMDEIEREYQATQEALEIKRNKSSMIMDEVMGLPGRPADKQSKRDRGSKTRG